MTTSRAELAVALPRRLVNSRNLGLASSIGPKSAWCFSHQPFTPCLPGGGNVWPVLSGCVQTYLFYPPNWSGLTLPVTRHRWPPAAQQA
jgi:hypothetical protein